ncbi:MAG: SlyX family protein [Rhizobiaceae bacterium]
MSGEKDERITKLEILVAEQEHTIAELSGQLAEQWAVMDKMRKKLDALTERFLALEEQTQPETPVTKPPHY